MVVSDTWNVIDMIHYFSEVGIWASLGRNENVIRSLTRKSAVCCQLSCEIVMLAEHEIDTKS